MSETTSAKSPKGTTKQKAAASGAKLDESHKKDLSQQIKALEAEAAEGDVVVSFRDEAFTLRSAAFQERLADDYEFMEQVTDGNLPAMVREVLSSEDQERLKELVRDPDSKKIKTEVFAKAFGELMAEGGLGN